MMKTSKIKATSNSRKIPDAGKTVKGTNVTSGKSAPSEEKIREKAMEIYYERISRGEHGTPEGDWREAEELLRGS